MPSGAAAAAPNALAAMPAATAKSRIAVGSTMAVRWAGGAPIASSQPRITAAGQVGEQSQQDPGVAGPQVKLARHLPQQHEQAGRSQHPEDRLLASAERIEGPHRGPGDQRESYDQRQGRQQPEL